MVASPRALALIDRGARELWRVFGSAPDLAPARATLHQLLIDALGAPVADLAALGLTTAQGFAWFGIDGGPHRCQTPSKTWQRDPIWRALEVEAEQQGQFRYAYRSDGKTFSARAIGDLDCDGTEITYERTGAVENGQPVFHPVVPPANAD